MANVDPNPAAGNAVARASPFSPHPEQPLRVDSVVAERVAAHCFGRDRQALMMEVLEALDWTDAGSIQQILLLHGGPTIPVDTMLNWLFNNGKIHEDKRVAWHARCMAFVACFITAVSFPAVSLPAAGSRGVKRQSEGDEGRTTSTRPSGKHPARITRLPPDDLYCLITAHPRFWAYLVVGADLTVRRLDGEEKIRCVCGEERDRKQAYNWLRHIRSCSTEARGMQIALAKPDKDQPWPRAPNDEELAALRALPDDAYHNIPGEWRELVAPPPASASPPPPAAAARREQHAAAQDALLSAPAPLAPMDVGPCSSSALLGDPSMAVVERHDSIYHAVEQLIQHQGRDGVLLVLHSALRAVQPGSSSTAINPALLASNFHSAPPSDNPT